MLFLPAALASAWLLLGPFCALPLAGEPAGETALSVLLVSGRNNHDWKRTAPELERILEASGRFAVDIIEDPSSFDRSRLSKYDAIASNRTAWPKLKERSLRSWSCSSTWTTVQSEDREEP